MRIITPRHAVRALKDRLAAAVVRWRHRRELRRVREKLTLRVVFLVIRESVWKVDGVFQEMLEHPRIEPSILVCPETIYSSFSTETMAACRNAFVKRGYPVQVAYDGTSDRWLSLDRDVQPDILFFTNPHDLTRPEYYRHAFSRYLSCYVPYAHQVSHYNNHQSQHNQLFHNSMWLQFAPHIYDKQIAARVARSRGRNVVVTGYPGVETLMSGDESKSSRWKKHDLRKKRVIWASHHTITSSLLPYSTFLTYAELFRELASSHSDIVQWAFKPHPHLRPQLAKHPDWGETRTDEYYAFWESSPNSQLDTGEYLDLFMQSDALIHDCGSFLAEYLYTEKPVMYLMREDNGPQFFNEFGNKALRACYQGRSAQDISDFIEQLVAGQDPMMAKRQAFKAAEIAPYFLKTTPSKAILTHIEAALSA